MELENSKASVPEIHPVMTSKESFLYSVSIMGTTERLEGVITQKTFEQGLFWWLLIPGSLLSAFAAVVIASSPGKPDESSLYYLLAYTILLFVLGLVSVISFLNKRSIWKRLTAIMLANFCVLHCIGIGLLWGAWFFCILYAFIILLHLYCLIKLVQLDKDNWSDIVLPGSAADNRFLNGLYQGLIYGTTWTIYQELLLILPMSIVQCFSGYSHGSASWYTVVWMVIPFYTYLFGMWHSFFSRKEYRWTILFPWLFIILLVYLSIAENLDWNFRIITLDEYMLIGWLTPLLGICIHALWFRLLRPRLQASSLQ